MSFSIRSNSAALAAQTNLSSTSEALAKTMNQLSSGDRIINAGDDAAGLGISRNLEAQIASYNQASRNAKDGMSLAQTANGYLATVQDQLSRLRTLAMQAASDGIGVTQRGYDNTEAQQITAELNRTSSTAEFNGTSLFESSVALSFQVGIRSTAATDAISVDTTGMNIDASTLLGGAIDLSSVAGAQAALADIDTAINTVSGYVATLGAASNRFESVTSTIAKAVKNLSDADERIRDTDITAASSQLARQNVLAQAGISVQAQANQLPQMALKLLG